MKAAAGFAALCLLLGSPAGHASEKQRPSFAWPGGATLAVSLSYDDALPSQLDNALPALNALGLKASFYLTLSSETLAQRLPEWRAAAAAGHELGNHTIFHPCSRSAASDRDWVAPHRDLDRLSVAALRDEIVAANGFLHAIDGRTERTFTAPCGDLRAGGEPYLPAILPLFLGIKSRSGGVTDDVLAQDLHDVSTWAPVAADADALIGFLERAAAASSGRGLASITFHGIGGDYLAVSKHAHERLLRHLATHPGRYWVATFADVARRARQPAAQWP
ncbi:polysaccharide deacetylase family protein [Pseudaquabacterium terrae]|uniref:polysaccharide deacetylase family protein n=1 Tax=Pseudaquabacterium terrae TaxID=2732868 RepID=UPI0031B5D052